MSKIAQAIFNLRSAIMETNRDAKIVGITLNRLAERELFKQLEHTIYPVNMAPLELTQTHKIKKIFDIPLRVSENYPGEKYD